MNVLEHIEDDRATLCRFRSRSAIGRTSRVTRPFHEGPLRHARPAFEPLRRCSSDELRGAVTAAGFEIELTILNRPAVFGWWLNSRVLKRRVMPKGQLKAFAG